MPFASPPYCLKKMCRIAGIASPVYPLALLQQTVAAMCAVLRHGGPDDGGMYTCREHGLVLGHRRLSLIDLAASGHQPMHYGEGRYTLSFNGEIYNYRELRSELKTLGFGFVSNSDTEVVLAAFAAWGTAAFARLNGMFAFALFDQRTADLYLVRDALGIKPLYYSLRKNTLVFASEVRAFYQLPEVPDSHPDWPVFLMAYGHLPEPVTTLRGVVPLRKGSFLQFNLLSGRKTAESFERFSFYEKQRSREDSLQAIRETLKQAVARHLLCDAPLGVFLSGGVDSSILALLAGEALGDQLNTLSLDFSETGYSEKPYQDLVRRQLGSQHYQHLLEEQEFHFHLPGIISAMDLPSSDGINTWFISKNAKKAGLKAVLSGLGGDELFGGYPSFQRTALATLLQKLPGKFLRASRYSKAKKYKRLAYLGLEGARGQYLFLRGQFVPSAIAAYLDMDEQSVWYLLETAPGLPDIHHLSPGNKASWMELNLYLQNQLLRDADVMSMTHGLEIRVPFLDKTMVKLALSLESGQKYAGPFGKQLLIDAFRHCLPEPVWNRRKMGFSFPFKEWLKKDEWTRSRMMSGGKQSIATLKQFDRGELHWSGLLTTILLRSHHYEAQPAFFNA